jgi:hypothetical protein
MAERGYKIINQQGTYFIPVPQIELSFQMFNQYRQNLLRLFLPLLVFHLSKKWPAVVRCFPPTTYA